jgi:probable rRNA maturation factor
VSSSLFIKNRQRTIPVNVRYLRWLTRSVLQDLLFVEDFDLAIYIVRAPEMAKLNETFLQHKGSTDVITFDYSDNPSLIAHHSSPFLHGELFIGIDDAVAQAREFRTTWPSELARYVIHGILHLRGHDDLKPAARRKMKREEDRLLKKISESFPLRKIADKPKLRL